jgi:hypothetical protein
MQCACLFVVKAGLCFFFAKLLFAAINKLRAVFKEKTVIFLVPKLDSNNCQSLPVAMRLFFVRVL